MVFLTKIFNIDIFVRKANKHNRVIFVSCLTAQQKILKLWLR